ncbi:solute carrier family 35 member F4 isoform X1 [Petromyzon marinus]|uniref:solute carrier family 35 member F4 isoform X1 n=1 Tax=Petromyzon marinus TaxID=7757 RepID=UPI003F6FBBB7
MPPVRRLSDAGNPLASLGAAPRLPVSRSFMDVPSVSNGFASIEDRILRITGYYGYYPACSSHKRDESPTEARTEPEGGEGAGTPRCDRCCTPEGAHRSACGVGALLAVAACLVGVSQLARLSSSRVYAPFFLTWFATAWNVAFFPIYYLGHVASASERQSPLKLLRECTRLVGEDGMTVRLFLKRLAPFCTLWVLTHYLYLLALRKLPPSDASALFCCNKAFVFLLSWIVLKDKFMGVRIVAAILAIAGIVMMVYVDGFHHDSIVGVALAVGSASTSALYQVLFKMLLGSANFGETAHFLSSLGLFNILFVSAVPVVLYFTRVEYWPSASTLPWGCICGIACLLLAFNILVNFGVAVTYPTFISFGILLSVPGNAVTDALCTDVDFGSLRLPALLVICVAFLLLHLPEDWDEVALRLVQRLREKKREEGGAGDEHPELGMLSRSKSRAIAAC